MDWLDPLAVQGTLKSLLQHHSFKSINSSALSFIKVDLKLNIQETKIMASSPITSWQIDGETMQTVRVLIFSPPKSLQMVTVPMELKDACSLEEKL